MSAAVEFSSTSVNILESAVRYYLLGCFIWIKLALKFQKVCSTYIFNPRFCNSGWHSPSHLPFSSPSQRWETNPTQSGCRCNWTPGCQSSTALTWIPYKSVSVTLHLCCLWILVVIYNIDWLLSIFLAILLCIPLKSGEIHHWQGLQS